MDISFEFVDRKVSSGFLQKFWTQNSTNPITITTKVLPSWKSQTMFNRSQITNKIYTIHSKTNRQSLKLRVSMFMEATDNPSCSLTEENRCMTGSSGLTASRACLSCVSVTVAPSSTRSDTGLIAWWGWILSLYVWSYRICFNCGNLQNLIYGVLDLRC